MSYRRGFKDGHEIGFDRGLEYGKALGQIRERMDATRRSVEARLGQIRKRIERLEDATRG